MPVGDTEDEPALTLRADTAVWQDVDGDVVVLHLKDSAYLTLNGSAGVLWRLLAAGTRRERLCEELVSTYGIDEVRATSDVDQFLARLEERSLI